MSSKWRKLKAELRRKYGKRGILMIPQEFIPDDLSFVEFAEQFRDWRGTIVFVRHDYEYTKFGIKRIKKNGRHRV